MELKYQNGITPTPAQLKEIQDYIMKEPAEGWGHDNSKGCRELMQYVKLEGFHGTYLYNVCVPRDTITIVAIH